MRVGSDLAIHNLLLANCRARPADDGFRTTDCRRRKLKAACLLLPFGTKLPAQDYAQHRASSQQEGPHKEDPKPCIVTGSCEPRHIRDGTAGGIEIGVCCEHVHSALRRLQSEHQGCFLHLATCQECEVPVARGAGLVHLDAEVELDLGLVEQAHHVGRVDLVLAGLFPPSVPHGTPTLLSCIESHELHWPHLIQTSLAFPLHVGPDLRCLCRIPCGLAEAEATKVPSTAGCQGDVGLELCLDLREGRVGAG
mmetsp:Transcript_48856/g.101709  ORF Transcript_48856/g.101709 Transcript_48856/m.101709 type:complete len:252 (+) Transcript_48856:338-1093(+)